MPKHCDKYIDDPSAPKPLKLFLENARAAASDRHDIAPELYATMVCDIERREFFEAGERVRVVMASRFGDVGITKSLDSDHGYSARVAVSDLCEFSDQP